MGLLIRFFFVIGEINEVKNMWLLNNNAVHVTVVRYKRAHFYMKPCKREQILPEALQILS